jgi:hypothetical protein
MSTILEFPTLDANRTIRQPLGSQYRFAVIVERFTVMRAGQWVSGIDVEITEGPAHKPTRVWQREFESMAMAECWIGETIMNQNRELNEENDEN